MTSLLDAPPVSALVEGVPRPRILWTPPTVATTAAGDEAVELAAMAGLVLDEWQQFDLRQAMAEDARGKWAAFEVGLVVSRQNGKGSILEARELAGLFLLGERLLIHSAHLFDTAMEHFRRILELVESTPEFASKVKRVSQSHGSEGIELKSGQRLRFKTRTKSGGRGLSGDLVVLDEAMILDDSAVGALMPTMAAKSVHGNPQIWYTASAGNEDSFVLGRLRRRGLAQNDPSLCYMEHSVDESVYNAAPASVAVDPAHIAVANPTLGIRMSLDHALREQRSMDPVEYARERLGVGQWPPEPGESEAISRAAWAVLADPDEPRGRNPVFGVATAPDRSWSAVGVAWRRPDGAVQVMLTDYRPDAVWVAEYVAGLRRKWGGRVLVDVASRDLVPGAEELSPGEQARAHNALSDAVTAGTVRHGNEAALNTAVKGARWRLTGDTRVLDRKGSVDISPLAAVALAAFGVTVSVTKPGRFVVI